MDEPERKVTERPKRDRYRDPIVVGIAILVGFGVVIGLVVNKQVTNDPAPYLPAVSSGHN